LVLSGQFAWEGAVALAKHEDSGCVASHRYPILRGKKDIAESAYLLSFFRTGEGHMLLDHHSRGGAGRNRPLNVLTLLKEKIPVPPLNIQREIADIVRQEQSINHIVLNQIVVLREFRARLISDVVTGKVDVRGLSVPEVSEEELQMLGCQFDEIEDVINDEEMIDEAD
jgi:type I restriction enzyme S subunit